MELPILVWERGDEGFFVIVVGNKNRIDKHRLD